MARGTRIVVSELPRGVRREGIISGTPLPGQCVEIDPTVTTLSNGRVQYRVYQPGTSGNRKTIYLLEEDADQGFTSTTAYVSGTRCFVYTPVAGEEVNVLVKGGTNPAFGDRVMLETGSGKVIALSGSQQSEPFQMMEGITNASDQLGWAVYTGY